MSRMMFPFLPDVEVLEFPKIQWSYLAFRNTSVIPSNMRDFQKCPSRPGIVLPNASCQHFQNQPTMLSVIGASIVKDVTNMQSCRTDTNLIKSEALQWGICMQRIEFNFLR